METKANIIYTVKGSDKYWTGAAGEGVTAFVRQSVVDPVVEALENIIGECPNSVEYGDWPELQEMVDKAQLALEAYRKGMGQ